MNIVVGSGPSGVFAAAALLARGESVTLLDVGAVLDSRIAERASALAAIEPEEWSDGAMDFARPQGPLDDRLPKASFGSVYPYALDEIDRWEQRGTRCLHSYARGGLSTVWGAAVLPFREADLAGWPVTERDLAPHYAAVSARIGVAGDDALAPDFPAHAPLHPPAPLSRQAARIHARMTAHRESLRAQGFTFGRSRLALRTQAGDRRRCRSIAQCHVGCPYGAIWSACDLLDELRADPRMRYRPGVRVERVEHTASGVRVHGHDAAREGALTVEGARAFVGCGPIGTARIVARSLERRALELPLTYQPYFLLPMAMLDGVDGVEEERLHSLAQLFLELDDARVSPRRVHLQIYTYNTLIRDRVDALTGRFGPRGAQIRRAVTPRLAAVQGYLHSDEAPPIVLRIDAGARCPVSLRAPDGAGARAAIRRVVRALGRNARRLGMIPLIPWAHVGSPGEGNHIGATFPMRAAPGALETDRLGTLPGYPRMHLIDASVLPTLPAPTLTLSIMANAHRIATEASEAPCGAP